MEEETLWWAVGVGPGNLAAGQARRGLAKADAAVGGWGWGGGGVKGMGTMRSLNDCIPRKPKSLKSKNTCKTKRNKQKTLFE